MKPQFVSRPAPAVSLANVKQACPTPAVPGRMQCQALVRTNVKGHAGVVPNVTPSGYGPSDLQSAYSLAAAAASAGTGETVAIVDAYDDPNAEADLGVYRTQYGLPACTVASSCLTIVNQSGGSALPATDPSGGWEEEESLDLDMVSAVCPNCKILLVEANAPDISDFAAAEDYAASHAKFVSNSWGSGGEFIGENYYDSAFNHPGVAITAAAGDSGYGAQYPAASQYVTSVGGTSLARDSAASRGWDESAWGGTGSGCSALEPAPVWQQINVSRTPGCENRTENDVAAVADPNTGVAVYDSYPATGVTAGWGVDGGTSAATPIIASVYALAGNPAPDSYPAQYVGSGTAPGLYDVTGGIRNGVCETDRVYLCQAGYGYDGPTGWGTPDGVTAFKPPTSDLVTIEDPGTVDYQIGGPVSLQLHGHDSAGLPLDFTALAGTLPYGLTISTAGLISGTPSKVPYTAVAEVTAQDSTGAKDTVSFSFVGVPSLRASYHPVAGLAHSGVSGKCMADYGNRTANGTKVVIESCSSTASQDWTFQPDGGPGGAGTLTVHGKCLDIAKRGTASGSLLDIWSCTGVPNQQWYLAGFGQLVNPVSGKCVADPGSSKANGKQLWIWSCLGTANQAWTLAASPVQSGIAGKCLDGTSKKPVNGTKAQLYSCTGGANQKWVLAANGELRVHGKCLSVAGNSMFDGAGIQLWACSGSAGQTWLVGPYGELINEGSSLCLDDPGDATANRTQMVQNDCYGKAGEVWAAS